MYCPVWVSYSSPNPPQLLVQHPTGREWKTEHCWTQCKHGPASTKTSVYYHHSFTKLKIYNCSFC